MHRLLCAAALTLLLAQPSLADDQAAANRLFVAAVQAWTEAQALPADAPERAQRLALVARNLHAIVEAYPGSDLAVKLVIGETVGPLSLSLADEAAAEGSNGDPDCVEAACLAERLMAAVAAMPPEALRFNVQFGQVRLLAEAGRRAEAEALAAAAAPELRSSMWFQIAAGLALGGDAEAALAVAGSVASEGQSKDLSRWSALGNALVKSGATDAAPELLDRLGPAASEEKLRVERGLRLVDLGRLDEALSLADGLRPGQGPDALRSRVALARLMPRHRRTAPRCAAPADPGAPTAADTSHARHECHWRWGRSGSRGWYGDRSALRHPLASAAA
jgi:hypothetical protein